MPPHFRALVLVKAVRDIVGETARVQIEHSLRGNLYCEIRQNARRKGHIAIKVVIKAIKLIQIDIRSTAEAEQLRFWFHMLFFGDFDCLVLAERKIQDGDAVTFYNLSDGEGMRVYHRGVSLVLVKAVRDIVGETARVLGPKLFLPPHFRAPRNYFSFSPCLIYAFFFSLFSCEAQFFSFFESERPWGVEPGTTFGALAQELQKDFPSPILLAKQGNNLQELGSKIQDGDAVTFYNLSDGEVSSFLYFPAKRSSFLFLKAKDPGALPQTPQAL